MLFRRALKLSCRGFAVALILACLAARPVFAQPPAPASLQGALHSQLETELNRVADRLDGVLGFALKDLSTGETLFRFPDTVFPQASSIKITILLELMRQAQQGRLTLDEKHTVRRSETVRGGPILQQLGDATVTLTLRDLAVLMVVLSDNSATNILIDRLGMDNVNAGIERLGLKSTHLRRRMMDLEAARRGDENISTPREMMALLEKVRAGEALDAAHTQEFFSLLRLAKESLFHKALPDTVSIADKPGSLEAVRCDSGVIELPGRPFVLTVMTTYLVRDVDGERAIEEIARLAYSYFDRLGRASPYGRVVSEK